MALPRVTSAWPTFNQEKHAFSTANQKCLLPSANLGANPAAYLVRSEESAKRPTHGAMIRDAALWVPRSD